MAKEEGILVEGKVVAALANTQFRVKLDSGHEVIAHIAGKIRKHWVTGGPATTAAGQRVVCGGSGRFA